MKKASGVLAGLGCKKTSSSCAPGGCKTGVVPGGRWLMVAGASPALVSSLLIHGDQSVSFDVWLSVCPFHTRCAVVNSAFCCATQLPSQFATLRFACAFTIKSAGQFYILAYRPDWHSLTPAWTVAGNEFTSYRDAADLMAPSSRQGRCADYPRSTSASELCQNDHYNLTDGHAATSVGE